MFTKQECFNRKIRISTNTDTCCLFIYANVHTQISTAYIMLVEPRQLSIKGVYQIECLISFHATFSWKLYGIVRLKNDWSFNWISKTGVFQFVLQHWFRPQCKVTQTEKLWNMHSFANISAVSKLRTNLIFRFRDCAKFPAYSAVLRVLGAGWMRASCHISPSMNAE